MFTSEQLVQIVLTATLCITILFSIAIVSDCAQSECYKRNMEASDGN